MSHPQQRRWLAALVGGVIVASGLTGLTATIAGPAQAATLNTQFRGVNWADARDNFVDGPVIPSGLSTSDSYATTYAKSTAILTGFQNTLGANTVRFGMNPKTTSSSWWASYTAAFDATLAKGMNVMLAPWAYPQSAGQIANLNDFWTMWDAVVAKYGSNSRFYFEIMNEPGQMSESQWLTVAAQFLARYPNLPRGQIVVAGTGYDANIGPVGRDSRFNGTLLSLHIYSVFGTVHTTEQAWIDQINSQLGGYGSRTIVTEFGVPMTTGVNYNGARDGDNNRSYYWGITDTIRSLGMGGIYWPGLRTGDQWAMTSLNGSGTNLSLSVNNASGLARLQYAWAVSGGTSTSTTTTPATTTTTRATTTRPATTTTRSTSTTTGSGQGGRACTAAYTVTGQWQGGFQGNVNITAGSTAITGWTVTWTFPDGQTISQAWNTTVTSTGSAVTARNVSYNGALAPAQSTAFGFIGSWNNATNATPVLTCTAS